MKERPILFNDAMVRAILEGRKTQTRRALNPQPLDEYGRLLGPELYSPTVIDRYGCEQPGPEVFGAYTEDGDFGIKCPYGKPGDRLWVRENFLQLMRGEVAAGDVKYLATEDPRSTATPRNIGFWWRKRPSIHMPRWASRITLEITGVRVERLQDISEADAKAEGAQHFPDLPGKSPYGQDCRWSMEQPDSVYKCLSSARWAFANYFCKIAGKASKGLHDPEPWDANPWVWVIEFRRATDANP